MDFRNNIRIRHCSGRANHLGLAVKEHRMDDQEQAVPLSEEGIGEVRISTDVIVVIAHTTATETEGVAGMSAGIADNISQVLGRKGASKGVKVELSEQETSIDLFLIVNYGARIPDVAWRVQERVKAAVETMTGLNVKAINIHVQGVSFESKGQ